MRRSSAAGRGVAALLLPWCAAAAAPQDPVPQHPPLRHVDARARPQEIELTFALSEEERGALFLELREPEPGAPLRELSLRFDPFEGAHWHWSVRPAGTPADRRYDAASRTADATPLTGVPEAPELRYRIVLRFAAGGGLEATLPEGAPIVVARTGALLEARLRVEGGARDVSWSEPVARGDEQLGAALAALPDAPATRPPPPPSEPALPPFLAAELPVRGVPPLLSLRGVDRIAAPEGALERVILEARPNVEIPVLRLAPAAEPGGAPERAPFLLVCGSEEGKAAHDALALAAALVSRGATLFACDGFDGGERRFNASFDSRLDPELRLVGSSPAELFADEVAQVAAWIAQRPDAHGRPPQLLLDRAAAAALSEANALHRREDVALPVPGQPASVTLAQAAVFGEEHLRARYDSDLLALALARREHVALPDAALPLLERMGAPPSPPHPLPPALRYDPARGAAAWHAEGAWAGEAHRRVLAAADFGPRAALHAALAGLPMDEPALVLATGGPIASLDAAVGELLARLEQAGAPCHLFGEGAWGVVALLAAARAPEQVATLTTRASPPSFEILLRRPLDSVRAAPRFGLLSQGQPDALFVGDAFSRFELEECVLALRDVDVPVEWRDPVDALRRPLDRHQRLSMWPRVRHHERPPR